MLRFPLITLLTLGWLLRFDGAILIKTGAQNGPHKVQHKVQIEQLRQKLREPMPPVNQPAARDALAKQQAEAAIALMKLGQTGQFWPLLRHSSDESRRTYLIHGLARAGVNPSIIARRLETEKDVSVRRALIVFHFRPHVERGHESGARARPPLR